MGWRCLRRACRYPGRGELGLDISVVIACYNGAATLGETLEALTAQQAPVAWEIVLADNGSTDASAALFAAHARRHPGVPMRAVAAPERGKSHALNAGIRAAAGRSLLFCDADDAPAPGWLAAMAGALEDHAFVAARIDLDALNPGWTSAYRGNAQAEGRLVALQHAPRCLVAGGGTFGFRREVFAAVGDFDPAFRYLEDTDYCVRAHLRGIALHLVTEAVMRVRCRAAPKGIYRQARNYARYRALLRRRYAPDAAPLRPGPCLRLTGRMVRLAAARLLREVGVKPRDPLVLAQLNLRLGTAAGSLAGALAYRVSPA